MLRKNVASQRIFFGLVNASTGAALTGAAVTARIALDGAAQAAAAGSVTELGNGQYRFDPAAADTNGDFVGYLFTAASAIPVAANFVTTATNPHDANLGLTNLDAAVSTRLATAGYTAPSNATIATIAGYLDTEVAAILAAVDTEVATLVTRLGTPAGASLAADVAAVKAETANIQADTNDLQTQIGAAGAGLTAVASAANLATVAGYLDTEIAAIKAKTDSLTFTAAGVVDANIRRVNSVVVTGTGASGDEWGP